jgi:hypothetical protein
MVNAWSLLYEELNGTMDETYPIKKNIDEIKLEGVAEGVVTIPNDIEHSDAYYDWDRNGLTENPFIVGSGNTASEDFVKFDLDIGNVSIDTSNYDFDAPFSQNFLADNDDSVAHHFENITNYQSAPSIKNPCNRKYEEDKSIKALQDYVSTTYGGHYTSERNDVQTLDLIESVGDGEAFCRSNAIKYLSRYDKKGQAKRDILKALHYTLLLYYFSGNTKENETPTRGYETF